MIMLQQTGAVSMLNMEPIGGKNGARLKIIASNGQHGIVLSVAVQVCKIIIANANKIIQKTKGAINTFENGPIISVLDVTITRMKIGVQMEHTDQIGNQVGDFSCIIRNTD